MPYLVCCLIVVVTFMGPTRAYSLGGEILKSSYRGQAAKRWDHFYGSSRPVQTPCKDINLEIGGGLSWMK